MEGSTAVRAPAARLSQVRAHFLGDGSAMPVLHGALPQRPRRHARGCSRLAVAVVLLGVAVMLVIAGGILENRVDDRIDEVNKDFDASLNRFREDVKKELDARIPRHGRRAASPTPTPFPTETPTPTPTPERRRRRPRPPSPTPTTSAEATPTETPRDRDQALEPVL